MRSITKAEAIFNAMSNSGACHECGHHIRQHIDHRRSTKNGNQFTCIAPFCLCRRKSIRYRTGPTGAHSEWRWEDS